MPESVEHKQLVKQPLAAGFEGQPIDLIGNFYRIINPTADVSVYHYDVDIGKFRPPRRPRDGDMAAGPAKESDELQQRPLSDEMKLAQERFIKKFSDKIVEKVVADNANIFKDVPYVYDGFKNLYTTKLLELNSDTVALTVEMDIDNRPANFKVILRQVDKVSLAEAKDYYENKSGAKVISERVLAVYDIIFRFVVGKSYEQYQRKFFDTSETGIQGSNKVKLCEFVQGFVNSIRMTEFGLAMNVSDSFCLLYLQ